MGVKSCGLLKMTRVISRTRSENPLRPPGLQEVSSSPYRPQPGKKILPNKREHAALLWLAYYKTPHDTPNRAPLQRTSYAAVVGRADPVYPPHPRNIPQPPSPAFPCCHSPAAVAHLFVQG